MSARRGPFAIGERGLRPRRQAPPRARVRLRRGRQAELVPLCCGSARPAVPGPRPAPPARLPAMEPGPDGPAASGPAAIREGWFRETCSLWPGQALSLQVEQLLHHRRSRYQDILVFRSKTYGNVLVLDGVIQCTERDEFSYQEMIANLPLCSHANPRKVLIIGGGDGGVLREVVKHPSVESVVQCEIDEDVIQVSKKFLPGMAIGYSSSKLTLHVGDGFEFMKQNQDAFDVIITDSSDPMGPAESLFKESYYQLMKTALKEDGVLCCQGECQWLHLDLIKEMRQFCQSLFPVVAYAYCTIPTYPSGQIGFMLCSKNPSTNFQEPVQPLTQQQVAQMQLKYYNSDVHRAAFVLPEFARKVGGLWGQAGGPRDPEHPPDWPRVPPGPE
uniref:Spermidine synthase n=1 Tax=Papio anubis TaxID=9555 RepID=A0A096NCR7_PAPAN